MKTKKANGKRNGVLFEALNHYTVTDSALESMAQNPHNVNVLAKAYIINTEEADKNKISFTH